MTIQEAIGALLDGQNLSEDAMRDVMESVMSGEATPAQIAAVLVLLRRKGETVEEITGAARVMRAKAIRIDAGRGPVLDTCGTGGDGKGTFNVSTAASLVAAAAGATVAKHGNRAMSGRVGGADVLEALGIAVDVEPAETEARLRETGFAFLFAPRLHLAMKHAGPVRRELGVRTIFNLLGPLSNPAGARHQLLGVFDARWVEPLARVLGRLGSVHALVAHGEDGLDEISLAAPTFVAELRDGRVETFRVSPETYGLEPCRPEDLTVANAAESAALVRAALSGASGPARDIVLLNAGAAIYAADLAPSIEAGIGLARETVDSGKAARLLDRLSRDARP